MSEVDLTVEVDQQRFRSGSEKAVWTLEKPKFHGLAITKRIQAYLYRMWPSANFYSTPLNNIFLIQIANPRQVNQRKIWLARDGLISLLWFFHQFPTPEGFRCRFLIDRDFLPYVPKAWSEHIGSYRLVGKSDVDINQPAKKVTILAGASSLNNSIERMEPQLQAMMIREGRKLKADVFAPARILAGMENNQTFQAEYFKGLFQSLAPESKVIGYRELMETDFEAGHRLYSLNEKTVIADDGLVHALLTRGAEWSGFGEVLASHEERIDLSPYHGMAVTFDTKIKERAEIAVNYEEYRKFQNRANEIEELSAYRILPWPQFFQEWVKAVADDFEWRAK